MTLTHWLTDLRHRNCRITITGRVIHIHGRAANDHDHQQIKRHHHALELAATNQHTDWWNTVLGRTPTHADTPIPTRPDDEWPCAHCGQPADHLDPQLLPWCHDHHQPEPEQEAAA